MLLQNEPEIKTEKRTNLTLGLEHATPYEHISVGFEITNIPKILAMVLNNERQCSTSEKSARYTPLDGELYLKWMEIFRTKIKKDYGCMFNDSKIEKLAQENARYMVTVFVPTQMIHTVPWIQLNRIVSFMEKYKSKENKTEFDEKLIASFDEFRDECDRLNLLDERAMSNRKDRSLAIFADKEFEDSFGTAYSTNYKGTHAQYAQAHRHRTLDYSMMLLEEKEYFIPPILKDEPILVDEWLKDISSVEHTNPQGELISINETGTYDKFILKTKERLCSAAQQEIMIQTRDTLMKYKAALEAANHPLAEDIKKYSKGARCTFKDYDCARDCKFAEGKNLTRKI